jgi:hypothetical protein
MGTLPQGLEITFEVQRKKNNEKITRRTLSFPTYKRCFVFIFSSFRTPPTFKPNNFLVSYSFKMIYSAIGALPEVLQIILEL